VLWQTQLWIKLFQLHKISIHFYNHCVQCSFIIWVLVNWIGYVVSFLYSS
jgi:hypothetical protein